MLRGPGGFFMSLFQDSVFFGAGPGHTHGPVTPVPIWARAVKMLSHGNPPVIVTLPRIEALPRALSPGSTLWLH